MAICSERDFGKFLKFFLGGGEDMPIRDPSKGLASASLIATGQPVSYLTDEMQLQAVYELQMWKESKEKEFEQHLKKIEAKKLKELAEAFKQHDVERELIVQKKLKEYNELEMMVKNTLSEIEKREKHLTLNEAQLSRIKADLNHEYENKLIELREASKRVQEKTDHQVNLHKLKCEQLEEEMAKYKRQVIEWEKRYADREVEFSRYRERENNKPEIRLQSESSILSLDVKFIIRWNY